MAKFNFDAPYGEVTPIEKGVMYWQSPNHFNANFDHVDHQTGAVIEKAAGSAPAPSLKTKRGKETPAEKKARQQAQLNPNAARKETVVGKVSNPNDGKIDLVAWANGTGPKGINWFAVKNQMAAEGYDPMPETANSAREMIIAKN